MSTLPYDFVPVPFDFGAVAEQHKTAPPVAHDGRNSASRWSGELHVTLTTLTPLLVGNVTYEAGAARGAQRDREKLVRLPTPFGVGQALDPKKKIIEPLLLASHDGDAPGAVAIAPRSIKGMLRHSIGALTASPMERVGERHYLFRPNLDRTEFKQPDEASLTAVPAVVQQVHADGALTLQLITWRGKSGLRELIWTTAGDEDGLRQLFAHVGPGQTTRINCARHADFSRGRKRFRLDPTALRQQGGTFRLLSYFTGQDGQGLHVQRFSDTKGELRTHNVHPWVIVDEQHLGPLLRLPADCVAMQELRHTYELLADEAIGHLRDHPRLNPGDIEPIREQIVARRHWQPQQLVFVELPVDALQGPVGPDDVISLGHHFRYYWKHSDSVRTVRYAPEEASEPRPEVSPSARETALTEDGRPQQLSRVRALFGFVSDRRNSGALQHDGPFARWAGRVSPNFAVEQQSGDRLTDRFLDAERCRAAPISGSPKPSAAEFYLAERNEPLPTADAIANDQPVHGYGERCADAIWYQASLRGRKFYRHGAFALAQQQLSPETVKSEQAPLLRFVLRPGRSLRLSIRFRDLSEIELQLLMAVLEPARLAHALSPSTTPDGTRYGLKLGFGRPWGMGSISARVDDLVLDDADDAVAKKQLLLSASGVLTRLDPDIARQWLEIHRVPDPLPELQYHREEGFKHGKKDGKPEIFNWHTAMRRKHALLRTRTRP